MTPMQAQRGGGRSFPTHSQSRL